MPSRLPRLLFSGYYGLGNAGDEAVLGGLLRGMKTAGLEAEVTVLSADPARTETWHGVRAVPRRKPDALRAIAACDLLVSGGGSLLQDVTSFASLGYYLGIVGAAQTLGKRVAIAAQGMGPLRRPFSRKAVGFVLKRADLLTVRDDASADLLRQCGIRKPLHVTADPAFLLPIPRPGERKEKSKRVGVALRSWPDRDAAGWGERLCRELRHLGCVPLLLPMQEPRDRVLAEEIARRVGAGVELPLPPERLDAVLESLGRCDGLIGMRLHALLLAAHADLPCLAWSYDPKVEALMRRIGAADGLLPLEIEPEAAATRMAASWEARPDPAALAGLREAALETLILLRSVLPTV